MIIVQLPILLFIVEYVALGSIVSATDDGSISNEAIGKNVINYVSPSCSKDCSIYPGCDHGCDACSWCNSTSIVPRAKDCKTISIPDLSTPNPDQSCIFPFKFRDEVYQKCYFEEELNNFLCGTKYEATDDEGWGICHDSCPKHEIDGDHACKVDEEPFERMLEICNCQDVNGTDDKLCQLNHEDLHTSCKTTADTSCRAAVASWADEYQNSENADDCYEIDPNYKLSQQAHNFCENGESGATLVSGTTNKQLIFIVVLFIQAIHF